MKFSLKKRLAILFGATVIAVPMVAAIQSPAEASYPIVTTQGVAGGVGTGPGESDSYDGSWAYNYKGNDVAIEWHDYDDNGLSYFKYHMAITNNTWFTDNGNLCVQIAIDLDETGLDGLHHDAQIMRNCSYDSARGMDPFWDGIRTDPSPPAQSQINNVNTRINRIQISTFDSSGSGTDVRDKVCIAGIGGDTSTSTNCSAWEPNGSYNSYARTVRWLTCCPPEDMYNNGFEFYDPNS